MGYNGIKHLSTGARFPPSTVPMFLAISSHSLWLETSSYQHQHRDNPTAKGCGAAAFPRTMLNLAAAFGGGLLMRRGVAGEMVLVGSRSKRLKDWRLIEEAVMGDLAGFNPQDG